MKFHLRARSLGAFAIAALVTAHGDQSSSSPQQPTFVSGTQAVRVDVHVSRDGTPLDDLRREEVQIFEDGTLQAIQTFERIAFAEPRSAPTSAARTLQRSSELVADPRSRVFVVFLDTRHTSYLDPTVQTRFPILRTLEKMFGPDDLVAIMTPDMRAVDISFDRGLAALARLEGTFTTSRLHPDEGMLRDPKVLLYESCYPPQLQGSPGREMIARYYERMAFDALDDLIGHLGAVREEPKHVFAITDGWPMFTEHRDLANIREGPRIPRPPLGGRGRDPVGVITERGTVTLTETASRECEADLQTLAAMDNRDRLDEIAAHANANNVSFYPISAKGLTTTSVAGAPAAKGTYRNTTSLFGQDLLRALARDTGGMAIVNTNNLDALIQDVMTSTSAYYLVGYSSTNSARDGRYRRISVKVNRPGVTIRARPGYVAARAEESRVVQPTESPVKPDPVRSAIDGLERQVRLAGERATALPSGSSGRILSDVVLSRRGSSPALPFEPTIDPRFRRNERLRLAVQKRGEAAATARLLDRRGAMLTAVTQIAERPDSSGKFQWIEVDLALASLAQGDYAIEVTSGDEMHVVAFRIIQ